MYAFDNKKMNTLLSKKNKNHAKGSGKTSI